MGELVTLSGWLHRDLGLVRKVILTVDHHWLRTHLWGYVHPHLTRDADYENFRAYATLLAEAGLDADLRRLLEIGRARLDPDISEVVEDFSFVGDEID